MNYEHIINNTTGEELGKRKNQMIFTHDIEEFTFDTTGYVEELGE